MFCIGGRNYGVRDPSKLKAINLYSLSGRCSAEDFTRRTENLITLATSRAKQKPNMY